MESIENTKEKIQRVAISLFAQRGYERVSMREIASECGIKGASIYYHFSSKRQILEESLGLMVSRLNPPSDFLSDLDKFVDDNNLHDILIFNSQDYKDTFKVDPMMSDIIRVVMMELHTDLELRRMFRYVTIEQPRLIWSRIFQRLMDKNRIRKTDLDALVNEYVLHGSGMFMEHFILADDFDVSSFLNIVDDIVEKRISLYISLLEV